MFKTLLMMIFACWAMVFNAANAIAAPASQQNVFAAFKQDNEFLPVEQAFIFDFRQSGNQLELNWTIAEGYYLYKDKIKIAGVAVSFSHPVMPTGEPHEDEYFGKTEVFRQKLTLTVPLSDIDPKDAVLKVRFQGCADAGLCYPPVTQEVPLFAQAASESTNAAVNNALNPTVNSDTAATESTKNNSNTAGNVSTQSELASRLGSDRGLLTLGLLFVLGLGLAFTPCVLPMYPILTSIIVGKAINSVPAKLFAYLLLMCKGWQSPTHCLG